MDQNNKLKYSKIANHKHLILICPEYFYLIRNTLKKSEVKLESL